MNNKTIKREAKKTSGTDAFAGFQTKLYDKPFYMENYQPPIIMKKEHWHNHIEFNYFFSGSMEYLFAGKTCRLPTGKIVMFWGGIPHRTIRTFPAGNGTDAKLFILYIPMEHFLLWNNTARIKNLLLSGYVLELNAPEKFISELVGIWSKDIEEKKELAMEAISLDIRSLISRYSYEILSKSDLLEKSVSQTGAPSLAKRDISVQKQKILVDILGFLLTHLREPFNIHDVALHVKLHDNYIQRIFKEQLGISISKFINSLRLVYSCSLLRETDSSILEISIESGFGSISQFYKAFNEYYRISPSSYRKQTSLQSR